jgi:hypothetical protein
MPGVGRRIASSFVDRDRKTRESYVASEAALPWARTLPMTLIVCAQGFVSILQFSTELSPGLYLLSTQSVLARTNNGAKCILKFVIFPGLPRLPVLVRNAPREQQHSVNTHFEGLQYIMNRHGSIFLFSPVHNCLSLPQTFAPLFDTYSNYNRDSSYSSQRFPPRNTPQVQHQL